MMLTTTSASILSSSLLPVSLGPETAENSTRHSLCQMVNLSAFSAHDDSKDVTSNKVTNVFVNTIHAVFLPALFLVGFPSNIVNTVVFFRHGLRQRINLCLFSLSGFDFILVTFAFLVYVERIGKDFNSTFRDVGRLTEIFVNSQVLGLYSGSVFSSQFISAIIAGERCLFVVWPLKSSAVLKTKTLGVVLLTGCLLIFTGRFVVVMKYHVFCVVDGETGSNYYFLTGSDFYRTRAGDIVDVLESLVYSLGVTVTLCIFITITTVITAIHLKKSTQFQKQSSSASAVPSLSARNVAVTKMLVYLSLQFIVLSSPNTFLRLTLIFLPPLSASGAWSNFYFVLIAVSELFAVLNSTLNFLVYYFFSSKYRQSVQDMFCKAGKDKLSGQKQS